MESLLLTLAPIILDILFGNDDSGSGLRKNNNEYKWVKYLKDNGYLDEIINILYEARERYLNDH
jgi:hypothetical protein